MRIQECIQKFPDWVDNEINNNKHSVRSNTKGYGGKSHYTGSQNSDTTARSGRDLYHSQLSRQVASPETFGYTLVSKRNLMSSFSKLWRRVELWSWGNIFLRNVGFLPQHYTASETRRTRLESSPTWRPHISQEKSQSGQRLEPDSREYKPGVELLL
jgi:hypothetical protein